jgi:hypothetical protein
VLATLSASRSGALIEAGEPTAAALTSGYHLAFGIGTVLVAVALAIASTVLEPGHQSEPEEDVDPVECEVA